MAAKTTKKAAAPRAGTAKGTAKAAAKPVPKSQRPFTDRLVLQQWLFEQLGVESFDDMRELLGGPGVEGLVPDGSMLRFTYTLLGRTLPPGGVTDAELRRYDANIRLVTKQIQGSRPPLTWKYFQYIALLFTEIYLDRYLGARDALLAGLNEAVKRKNRAAPGMPLDALPGYTVDDLGRLAFWCATGSGKTLLMHANIRQYQHYTIQAGLLKEHNRVLLLTPKDLLTTQHLDELRRSGFVAERFSRTKTSPLLDGTWRIDVMEITKLADRDGKDTVSVEGFGAHNLVLIDEGHQGLGSQEGAWKGRRDALSAKGFAFEYSATFLQAVQAAKGDEMAREYARCIALDYSYREFYRDGYGKEYTILNLKEDPSAALRQRYITGCLLSYYQQVRVYETDGEALQGFGIERPLWVFVGDSVSEIRKQQGREVSDVVDIILALHRFAHEPETARDDIEKILSGGSELLDTDDADVFAGRFTALQAHGDDAASLYRDVLARVFRTDAPGAVHVIERRGSEGELTLHVGAGPVFGLVKVGEPGKVRKLCEAEGKRVGVVVDPPVASAPIFETLHERGNRVHVLIGSRRFTEGWNSWRVSTLGLMNLGRSEGAQIIQLFGRGVRLRGWRGCLKRSAMLSRYDAPPKELPEALPVLETLGVFGLRADYMKTFEEALRSEKIASTKRVKGIEIPIDVSVPDQTLYTLVTPEADQKGWPRLTLSLPGVEQWGTDYLAQRKVLLDWYPNLDVKRSEGVASAGDTQSRHEGYLTAAHVALLDLDALVLTLLDQRARAHWWNLSITREGVRTLLASPDTWYRLSIPAELLAFKDVTRIALWQTLAEHLLRKYTERYYKRAMDVWSQPNMRYGPVVGIGENVDPNFKLVELPSTLQGGTTGWVVEMVDGFQESKDWDIFWRRIADGTAKVFERPPHDPPTASVLKPAQHLYTPLVFANPRGSQCFKVHPVPLNVGEWRFVVDLERYCNRKPTPLDGWSIWLLRNQAKRGVRFFEAQNFYPDFLLWLIKGKRQRLAFIDPKGIRNLQGLDDPKIQLAKAIKAREKSMPAPGDGTIIQMDSFIVANTHAQDVAWWQEHGETAPTIEAFATDHHVVFQNDERVDQQYIDRIVRMLVAV
ncbi:MAG: DEAD/DEAH box helicase family protein [Polyangiaceae bacterium]|nr:DEAD/DEAH box helicase family protein [Polyangiaceae bacterium]